MTTGELDKRQNIIYSDSILNLNKLGKNMKITSISSVEPHELQTCLKNIIDNNSNIEINTIQYSQGFKKIFFYANKKVDTTSWLKNEYNSNELIQKLKNTLNEATSSEVDEISINTVLSFLQEITEKQEIIKNNFKSKIDTKLKEKFGQGYYSNIYGMNYKTKELTLDISNITNYYKHSLVKNNDALYITEAETFEYTGEILDTIGEELLELYNWLLTLEQFYILPKKTPYPHTLLTLYIPRATPAQGNPLISFLSLWICLLWTLQINGIIQHMAFCDSLLSLNLMLSRFML